MAYLSDTATMAAICRAAHQILDDGPKMLDDPIATKFLSEETLAALRARDPMLMAVANPFTRLHFCLRSRVAEDCMQRAAAHSVEQFIVLGAGLDSFAYRQPIWAQSCKIVEVDHPKAQRQKTGLVKSRGLGPPENVSYLPIDFTAELLTDRLKQAGMEATRPLFVSWLGVSQYLPVDAVANVLGALGAWPSGCGLVMTYALADWSSLEPAVRAGAERAKEQAVSVGEPWLSSFSEQEIAALLRSVGFAALKPFTAAELQSVYFKADHAIKASAGPSRIIGAHSFEEGMSWFDLDPT
jgi:methyltransferase (TIGR00027 family)